MWRMLEDVVLAEEKVEVMFFRDIMNTTKKSNCLIKSCARHE